MNITTEFWDFIEQYLPCYYHRDDVLRHSDLQLFIDGHESSITGLSVEEAEKEISELTQKFMDEAINAYTKGEGTECPKCSKQRTNYCPHCGRKL